MTGMVSLGWCDEADGAHVAVSFAEVFWQLEFETSTSDLKSGMMQVHVPSV